MGSRGVIFRAAFAMGLVWLSLPGQLRFAEGGPVSLENGSAHSRKFGVGAEVIRLRGVSSADESEAVRNSAGRLAHLRRNA